MRIIEYRKIFEIRKSHLKMMNRKWFSKSFRNVKSFIKAFPGGKIYDLKQYDAVHLKQWKPGIKVIHLGCSKMSFKDLRYMKVRRSQ